MTFTTPCARPENDPNDWFIEKDGRQYSDEILVDPETVTDDQLKFLSESVQRQIHELSNGESLNMGAAYEVAMTELEEQIIAERLTARRHAKDACFTECIFRMHCLSKGEDEDHGTWGGYYTEERRKIAQLRAEKIAERAARRQAAEEG